MPPKGKSNNPNGRPKGAQNKATRDIRDFLQKNVDWEARVRNLEKFAAEGNMKAEELLWQYGYGKPVEIQIAPLTLQTQESKPIQHEHTHALDAGSTKNLMDLAKKLANR